MITLYTFGPYFGLPEASPFVTKAMLLLKIARLSYTEDRGGYARAPKGKLPFIEDDGVAIADSTFIRLHIEKKYGFDYDLGLNAEQKAVAWALEKLIEDHLYWLIVADRWLVDANFKKGPAQFFDAAPAALRPLIRLIIRRKVRAAARAQGLGRHSLDERRILARRALQAASTLLGDKAFVFGDVPHGVDATLGAFVIGALCPHFDSICREEAASFPNLVAYAERINAKFFA